jgi:hypothetical protein
MKSRMNLIPRRRLFLLAGLVFTFWAAWQVSQDEPVTKLVSERTVQRAPAKPAASEPALPLLWPARSDAPLLMNDLFSPPPPVMTATVVAPQGPVTPVFGLKYIGQLTNGDQSHVFLADDQDRVTTAKVGQTLDNEWLLKAMTASELVFRHAATGQERSLQIGTLQ